MAKDSSELSIKLNPFNSSARLNYLAQQLSLANAEPDQLEKVAAAGLRYAPSDPRFLSVLGAINARAGNDTAAQRLFSAALSKKPTEFLALHRSFGHSIKNGQFKAAARHAEVVGRRWQGQWPLLAPHIPAVLSDREAFGILADGLGNTDSGRQLLIGSLLKPDRLLHANRFLIYWHKRGHARLAPLIADVTNALIDGGHARAARALFLQTVASGKLDGSSQLYNSDFQYEFSQNPFDWVVRNQAGVSLVRETEEVVEDQKAAADTDKGTVPKVNVLLSFRKTPVILENLVQQTVLVPGEYKVDIKYRTEDLSAPKPVVLKVDCGAKGIFLARLEVDSGQSTFAVQTKSFRVPKNNCPIQRVYLGNDVKTQSWKDRYQGGLIVSRISLVRLGN